MFARYSVLNLSPLPAPPAPSMGCGGGDKKCRKSKESPPWVCEKCAKKSKDERNRRIMGCPEHGTASVEVDGETSEATLDLGRDGHSVGCMSRPPGAPDETSEGILDLGRDGHSIGCGYEAPEDVDETSEATLDLGCDKCQKGKKRRQAAARNNMNLFPTGRLNLQGGPMLRQVPLMGSGGGHGGRSVPYARNYEEDTEETWGQSGMLGQVPIVGLGNGGRGGRAFTYDHDRDRDYRYCDPSMENCPLPLVGPVLYGSGKKPCTGEHRVMGQAASYGCPVSAPDTSDPTLNCQRDARGNAVCSNGLYYPPGCPHTPPEQFFSPGIAPDEVHNGILEARVPAPRQAGSTGASGVPSAGGAPGASSATTNIVPLAAGGIAVVGLLYAIFR